MKGIRETVKVLQCFSMIPIPLTDAFVISQTLLSFHKSNLNFHRLNILAYGFQSVKVISYKNSS